MKDIPDPSRRHFLGSLLWLLGTAACQPAALASSGKASRTAGPAGPTYRLAAWTGDDFAIGHRLRTDDIPVCPKESESTVDFVIVGGGMAGLAAAYYLRDYDIRILEQYEELGGQSRGRSYRGIDYSLGAAYMGRNDGIYGQLFSDLSIKPVALAPDKNAFFWEGRWNTGPRGPDTSSFYKQLNAIIDDARKVWERIPDGPQLPLANADMEKLDSIPFQSYLQSFDSNFVSVLDSICKSSCCAGTAQLSALAGFYLLTDLVSPSYVFKGGNSAIARALRLRLDKAGSSRQITNAFVWRVSPGEKWVSVVYSTGDGALHKISCRHAIVTAPPLVAARIIPDLDDKTKSLLLWHKYGSYLVANFCLRKRLFEGTYDNWVGSPFTFSDFILSESPYRASGSYKPRMGQVLTVYQPYGNASPGRPLLMEGNRERFAATLLEQLEKLVPEIGRNLEEVVLTRWGHAMTIARPGMFARLSQLRDCDTGSVSLAHSSTEGMPSAESAIRAARRAADRALQVKRP